jgi:NADPH:quinone reductase-like Zn-dependent oxidoreductase
VKAAVIREHGGTDAIRVEDLPEPTPGEGEAMVEVHAAALNHLDIWVRKGRPGVVLQGPHVIGSDAAGVVVGLGAHVHGLKVGDSVVLNPALSCGCCEFCLRGEQSECMSFGIIGLNRSGTFAERIAVPATNLLPKPDHLDLNEAAALPLAYATAFRMLTTRARLQPGETVLIHGIGGGVALAGLQWAHLLGAKTIATSSSDDKLQRSRAYGATHLVNYTKQDVTAAVKDLTSGRGVDVVFDTVGAATWPLDFAVARKGGRIVICGVTTGAQAPSDLRALYWNQLTLMGSTLCSRDDFRAMLRAADVAGLKPVVDSVWPLARVKEASLRMESAHQFGKIVLAVQ